MVNLIDKLIFKPQLLNKNSNKLIKDLETSLINYYNIGKSFDSKKTHLKTLTIKKCDIEQMWRQLYLNANFFLKKNINPKSYEKMKKILKTEQDIKSVQYVQKNKTIIVVKKTLVKQEKKHLTKKLSSFEQKQEMINERINILEKQNLFGQTWQLMGEVDAKSIPDKELIAQKLKFESCDKFSPKITFENIEKIIKERIMVKKFDDVIIEKTLKKKRKNKEVNDKKSIFGLEELYKRDRIHDIEQVDLRTFENKKKLDEYKDIIRLKVELFQQLDSMTNFYFTTRSIIKNKDKKIIEFSH